VANLFQNLVNDDHTCAGDIVIQVPGSLVLQGYRVIDFNLETDTVKVELLAVARRICRMKCPMLGCPMSGVKFSCQTTR